MTNAKLLSTWLLVLSLIGSSGSSAFASPGDSLESSRYSASLNEQTRLERQEAELGSEIDRQADVVFRDFVATSGSRVPLSTLKKVQRAAVFRLHQMHVLTDILKAAGPAPATTIIATEVLTNFILAPLATVLGKPIVASAFLTVPWGLVTGFGVFSLQVMKERFLIARSLGRYTLRPLDQLRSMIVGYDLKYHVSSVIYRSIAEDVGDFEFEVLRNGWAFDKVSRKSIKIAELEAIVKSSPSGAHYLEIIDMEKLDPLFYSTLLLRFVSENDDLMGKLLDLVKTRIAGVEARTDSTSVRRHLLAVADVRTKLERENERLRKLQANLKKQMKAGTLSRADGTIQTQLIADDIKQRQDVRGQLIRHEYAVLIEAQAAVANGGSTQSAAVQSTRTAELSMLERAAFREQSSRMASSRPLMCEDLFR